MTPDLIEMGVRLSSLDDLLNAMQQIYDLLSSCSPADELDVTPVSTELMFAPLQRKFTVSEGDLLIDCLALVYMSSCHSRLVLFCSFSW